MQKSVAVLAAVLAAVLSAGAEDTKIDAQIDVGRKPGTTDKIAIVQPGPGGQTQILSRETVTEAETRAPRPDTAPDLAPRKARVAVVPAIYGQEVRSRFARELNEKMGMSDPSVMENPGYTMFLVDALVNSHKVDVLEREELRAATRELDLGDTDYADLAKVVRLGGLLNADYVVIPEIRYLAVLALEKEIPYVGQQQLTFKGKLTTGTRTVDVKTSRIVSSSMIDVGATNRVRRAEESPASPLRDVLDQLYLNAALKEAAAIVDSAYPIKIVAVMEAECMLNRGAGAILEGEELNVYQPGEMMIDPDTKENLGYHEARVGRVRIVKVADRTCTASILEGAGRLEKNFVCRREKAVEPPPEPVAAPVLDQPGESHE